MRASPAAVLAERRRAGGHRRGLLPSVMRGAASSDLPTPEQIAQIRSPTLILAGTAPGASGRNVERLHDLVSGSELLRRPDADGAADLGRAHRRLPGWRYGRHGGTETSSETRPTAGGRLLDGSLEQWAAPSLCAGWR